MIGFFTMDQSVPLESGCKVQQSSHPPFASRRIGRVNWLGLWTLYRKEVRRFWKVVTQTVLAPLVTTLLFMAIFTLALGGSGRMIGAIHFQNFLAPGLVMMAILQNAFANTSSSLMIAKVQGNIIDTLLPPLSAGELTVGYALGGATRGIVVGTVVVLALTPFIDMSVKHWLPVLYFGFSGALMLSLVGILTGIWSEKFDHMAAITNFVITPLSLLSGTFYSIEKLPGIWYSASQYNPFFYMIDGFRYGFIDIADGSLVRGALIVGAFNVFLWLLSYYLFKSGYKLRA
jgi:ABC-2 type transport system permease protein